MFVCPCNVHKRRAISSSGYYRCKKLIGEGRLALWVPPIEALPPSEVEDENGDAEHLELVNHVQGLHTQTQAEFASEICELVVRGVVRPTGVNGFLKIYARHYGLNLPDGTLIPASWYIVKKLVLKNGGSESRAPKHSLRHLCTECDWLFPLDTTVDTCIRCKKPTRWDPKKRGRPARTAVYFDMKSMLARMFQTAPLANALIDCKAKEQALDRLETPIKDRELDEAWHGTILEQLIVCQVRGAHALSGVNNDRDEEEDESEDEEEPHVQPHSGYSFSFPEDEVDAASSEEDAASSEEDEESEDKEPEVEDDEKDEVAVDAYVEDEVDHIRC